MFHVIGSVVISSLFVILVTNYRAADSLMQRVCSATSAHSINISGFCKPRGQFFA